MPDQTIECKDCGNAFVHDEKEQAFFQDMGYKNPPKRCVTCRKKRRFQTEAREANRGSTWDDEEKS